MGLMKKIKGSYMFTHMEVGKYTKRRTQNQKGETAVPAPPAMRPTEFVSEFEYVAQEMQLEEQRKRQVMQRSHTDSGVIGSSRHGLPHCRSSIELSPAQRQRMGQSSPSSTLSRATTAVASAQSPAASPFAPTDAFIDQQQPIPRPRPRGARGARSTVDMQSVYFAPGRNISMTNQQKQRQSMYPDEKDLASFDKHSASSVDYYVFTPSKREMASLPLDARRRQLRGGVVTYDHRPAETLHRSETLAEAGGVNNNPFVERRRKAHELNAQGWNSATPFDDPIVGSGRGGVDPDNPRKYLNTPLYASQTGAGGVDLLA
ncbi:hypothetical protein EV175_003358 [Coemansia sp. RSA 1933]|nr:hypothetical protein EV175_003358 [Coemansia sp. RSA 1933]